ncbi:hypothetical protein ACH4L5_21095 [Streptomyces sp. NPDC017405]|uniref:hypothetical protein n=1 Tax=unclassified Streptomyces TaxID=2593676 RepID=UPI003799932F
MEDWSVLDLARDPVPGDPARIQTLAARLLREAEYAEQHASRLRQVAANSADLRMQGDYAPLFQQRLARLPQQAAGLGPAHESCGRALVAYMQTLEQAKIQSRAALSRGMQADAQYKAALQQFCTLVPGFSYTGNWRELDESFALRCTQYQRPEVRAAAARIGAYAAQAERERQAAATTARQAARVAAEAEIRCAQAIRAAIPAPGSSVGWRSPLGSDMLAVADSRRLLANMPEEVTASLTGIRSGDEWLTGARRRPRDLLDDPAQTKWAEAAYDDFRQDSRDIAAISRNTENVSRANGTTGFTKEEIATIKKHIFDTEHPIEDYETGKIVTRKFDADAEIADAWIRLRSGNALPEDHVLLEHELAELNYLHTHPGATYQEAHRVANQSYNWQSMVPLNKREDFESEW